jgi:hypothetical protein
VVGYDGKVSYNLNDEDEIMELVEITIDRTKKEIMGQEQTPEQNTLAKAASFAAGFTATTIAINQIKSFLGRL